MMRGELPAACVTLLVLFSPAGCGETAHAWRADARVGWQARRDSAGPLADWPRCRGGRRRDAGKRRLRLEQRDDHR